MNINLQKLAGMLEASDERIKRQAFPQDAWDIANLLEAFAMIGRQYTPAFVVDSGNKACYTAMVKWLVCDTTFRSINPKTGRGMNGDPQKGLYIYGPTGTGKTLATRVLKKLARMLNIQVQKNGQQFPLDWTDVTCSEAVDLVMYGKSLDEFVSAKCICLQDLGSEPAEAIYMGNRVPVMRTMLERRGELENITIITSNISFDSGELESLYGDRVVSRLMSMCNFLVLGGEDRRRK